MIEKIISGGQTGADRAALDVALKLGIPHGGWIPKGRKTEKGPLPERYRLKEMPTDSYEARTEKNVPLQYFANDGLQHHPRFNIQSCRFAVGCHGGID